MSEAMLQQTQVARVVAKYTAFMQRFPTVRALAAAPEQDVLAAWQGLGYYGRARRLHAAATAIVERFGGEVPSDVGALRSLPGVGRYTAGAIASIAFGVRTPIVDTNVARVLMRLDARSGAASDPDNVAWTWHRAEELVRASGDPALFNEGLMELGASICPAAQPKCLLCPLAEECRARATGDPSAIPQVSRGAVRRRVYHHAVVFLRGAKVLLVQRPERGLWASMWQVPTIESDTLLDAGALQSVLPLMPVGLQKCYEFTHQTSHREVVFVVYRSRTRMRSGVWVDVEKLDAYPLSNPMRTIVNCSIVGTDARSGSTTPASRRRSSSTDTQCVSGESPRGS